MGRRRRRLANRVATPLVAFVAAAVLLTLAWNRLEQGGVGAGDSAAVLVFALAPVLAVAVGARRLIVGAALVAAAIGASAVAFGVSPLDARPGDHDFFGPVLGSIRTGFQSFYESQLPFQRADYAEMHGLVLFAIFGFATLAGMLTAARRTSAATLTLLVGLGWPATLVPGDRPLVAGALMLAGILLYLFLAKTDIRSWRSLAPAFVAGLAVVLAAVGASTSGAVSKGAFLNWQGWDLYDPPDDPVTVDYVWSGRYSGIDFPKKTTTVLKVHMDGPRRALYWRATTLDDYNGVGWIASSHLGAPQPPRSSIDVAAGDPLIPFGATTSDDVVRQDVTIAALRGNHLMAASQPIRWNPGSSLAYQRAPGGGIVLDGFLHQDQEYTAWSYAPRPTARELARAGDAYPNDLPSRYLEPLQAVRVPVFGTPGRSRIMRQTVFSPRSNDAYLAANRDLYELARRVTRQARTPYAAAVILEAWFRDPAKGEFRYDQHPPAAPSSTYPPLLDFVLNHRRGYCQHFAGAMALMLRFLGVPARVAAGFTSGTYDSDSGTWTVTDHNAHAWVEVFFPGYGWLPFDPTPGRGTLDAPYSYASTPGTSLSEKGADLALALGAAGVSRLGPNGVITTGPELPGRGQQVTLQEQRRNAQPGAADSVPTAPTSDESPLDSSLLLLLVLVGAGLAVATIAAKIVRRFARFATRDPRRIAAACRLDLVGFLRDQGTEPPPSATVKELGALVEREFALDVDPYVLNLSLARYGPPAGASTAANAARRELGRLRRGMWRQLSWAQRIRTALSFRSLAG